MTAVNALELRKEGAKLSQVVQQQAREIAMLHERNKTACRLLRDEGVYSEALIAKSNYPQDQNLDLIQKDYTYYLKQTKDKNMAFLEEMKRQEDVIIRLSQHSDDATDRLKKHTTQVLFLIEQQLERINELESKTADQNIALCDLRLKNALAEYGQQEQTRVAVALEGKSIKIQEIINNQAQVMLSELDYQEEVIDNLGEDASFLLLSHKTMVDMTENIERLTSDDRDSETEMTFELETEPDPQETITRLEDTIKFQSMQLEDQKRKLDEKTKMVMELEVQKRKLACDLEEQNAEVVSLLDTQSRLEQERASLIRGQRPGR